jgi:hypothetical protein
MQNSNKIPLYINIEREVAKLLLDKLKNGEMTIERATQIARFVLKTLPKNLSEEKLSEVVPKLDDEFIELSGVVYKYMLTYEEEYKPLVLEEVNDLVVHKHFEEANQLMKKYFKKKLQN